MRTDNQGGPLTLRIRAKELHKIRKRSEARHKERIRERIQAAREQTKKGKK